MFNSSQVTQITAAFRNGFSVTAKTTAETAPTRTPRTARLARRRATSSAGTSDAYQSKSCSMIYHGNNELRVQLFR